MKQPVFFKLDRYDFEGQFFPFTKETAMKNVGTIVIFSSTDFKPYCNLNGQPAVFPPEIYLMLNDALTLDKLKIPLDEVAGVLARMAEAKNKERRVYCRIRFRILDVPGSSNRKYARVDLAGKITSVDFFFDKEMTMPIGDVQLTASK